MNLIIKIKQSFLDYSQTIPRPVLFGLGIVFFIFVVILDFVTGPELSASLFYLIPVVFFSWFFGKRWGILACVLSSMSWFITDALSGSDPMHPTVPYLNAVVRLCTFLINSIFILKLREELVILKQTNAKLQQANEEIRRLTGK